MRMLAALLLLLSAACGGAWAQDPLSTYCDFTDGNEVSMQYNPVVKEEPHNGRIWSPGITLYVQVPLTLGGTPIPLGAYSVHIIPERKNWTLIVNRNVTAGAPYNSAQDVAKGQMELGELPEPTKQLQLTFAHMAPKQCSLRVYYKASGAFVDFMEK